MSLDWDSYCLWNMPVDTYTERATLLRSTANNNKNNNDNQPTNQTNTKPSEFCIYFRSKLKKSVAVLVLF